MEYRAALLASHGIASLALDYLTPKVTMETGKMVDFQYIEVNLLSLKDAKNPVKVPLESTKITPCSVNALMLGPLESSRAPKLSQSLMSH